MDSRMRGSRWWVVGGGLCACVACGGRKASGGLASPAPASLVASADTTPAYFEFQVGTKAAPLPGARGPKYPLELRMRGVTGEVLAQFVVDTSGAPEMGSFKVLRSKHKLFTKAVYDAVAEMRFSPAELNGRKVRMLVQQPFNFSISAKLP